jgi:hypothetical protein
MRDGAPHSEEIAKAIVSKNATLVFGQSYQNVSRETFWYD